MTAQTNWTMQSDLQPTLIYNSSLVSTMASLLPVLLIDHVDTDPLPLMRELLCGGYDVDYLRVDSQAAMDQALFTRVWDIIICSENLPQFDILQALATLKQSRIVLPFFLSASMMQNETTVMTFHLSGQDYIAKDGPAPLLPALAEELSDVQLRRSQKSKSAPSGE